MVTVTSSGTDRCVWCCQEKDGVVADFEDGLGGHFCWADFRKAVKKRSQNRERTKKGASRALLNREETEKTPHASKR
jgi:hypothetical protein